MASHAPAPNQPQQQPAPPPLAPHLQGLPWLQVKLEIPTGQQQTGTRLAHDVYDYSSNQESQIGEGTYGTVIACTRT